MNDPVMPGSSQPVAISGSTSTSAASPTTPPGVPYRVVLLCALSLFICYADRVNISVAVVSMSKELGWSTVEQGHILGAFFYGYVTSQLLGAALSVRYGGHRVLFSAAVGWSLLTLLTPTAARLGMTPLLICRVLMGVVEGAAFPSIFAILGPSLPTRRSTNLGWMNTAVFSGTVFALFASECLVAWSGWPSVFSWFGWTGLVWCLVWLWAINVHAPFFKHLGDLAGTASLGVATHKPTLSAPASRPLFDVAAAKMLLFHPSARPIYIAHFCQAWAHFVALAWLPTFFHDSETSAVDHDSQDKSLSTAADPAAAGEEEYHTQPMAVVPYILMAICNMAAARYSDHLLRLGHDRTATRRLVGGIGFFAASAMVAMFAFLPAGPMAIALLCLGLGVSSISCAGFEPAKLDVAPPGASALLQGVSNTLAACSGVVGVPIGAYLFEATGTWRSQFLLIAVIYAVGGLVFVRHVTTTRIEP